MFYASHFCRYEEEYKNGEHTYTFIGPCIKTGKEQRVTVKGPDLYKYNQGAKIQDAFPYLKRYEAEFLMSGYSKEGWDEAFPVSAVEDELG